MEEDVKKILEEHGKLLKEIHGHTTALHRALVWGRVWGVSRFVVFFVLPIALAYFYILPSFQSYLASFKQVTSGQMKPEQFLQNIPPLFQSALKLQGIDIEALQRQAQQQVQKKQR